jgi:hypothetical protein
VVPEIQRFFLMETRTGRPVPSGSGKFPADILKFLLLPAIAPLLVLALYFTPKETFGCAARGLLAFAVAILSLLCAVVTIMKYKTAKERGAAEAVRFLAAAFILILPAILLLGPLG